MPLSTSSNTKQQPQTPSTPRQRYHNHNRSSYTAPYSPGLPIRDSEILLLPPPPALVRGKRDKSYTGWIWKRRNAFLKAEFVAWVVAVVLILGCGVIIAEQWVESPVLGVMERLKEALHEQKSTVVVDADSGGLGGSDSGAEQSSIAGPTSTPMAVHSHTTISPSTEILSSLPKDDIPRAVILHDPNHPSGKNNHSYYWTIHMPQSLAYPLLPVTYSQLCTSAHMVSRNVSELNQPKHSVHSHSHAPYYHIDPTFLDPITFPTNHPPETKTCERTLTYYLSSPSSSHAGMGVSLMGLWLAYGLAQRENRTFFIDDTNWLWGNYTTYFRPVPTPSCIPPAKHLILPCPHSTSHLLVTPQTNSETFGHGFVDEYEVATARNVFRQENIFALARRGFENLFVLNSADEELFEDSVGEAWSIADEKFGVVSPQENQGEDNSASIYEGGMVVIHIRHGQAAKPREYWYSKGYLPLQRYVDVSIGLIGGENGPDEEDEEGGWGPVMLISDDRAVWKAEEMQGAWTAQVEFPPPWGVQTSTSSPSEKFNPRDIMEEKQKKRMTTEIESLPGFSFEGLRSLPLSERAKIGRGYLLDLKITSELASNPGKKGGGGVVCGGYSVTCRLLAVAMGWERGIVEGRWRDVDGWVWEGEGVAGEGEDGGQRWRRKGSGGEWRGWVW